MLKYFFQPKKFICDQKLHGKQNVGGVKARFQNDDMDWSQKMWTYLGLGFSIVSMEAIMGGECVSTMHVVRVVWFFLCCKFLLFLKTWGWLRDEEVVMENWWNNMWMRMCDRRTKWRCKELVKDMQVREGIFKLEIKYKQKFALVCVQL